MNDNRGLFQVYVTTPRLTGPAASRLVWDDNFYIPKISGSIGGVSSHLPLEPC